MTDITILNLLNTRPMYGAEMIDEIKHLSGNAVIMSLPTLYSSLHRMADKKYVRSYQKEGTVGGRCRVYNITNVGRDYLAKNPIKIDYQQIADQSVLTHKTYTSLEEAFSLPLNKNPLVPPELPEEKRILQIAPQPEPVKTKPTVKSIPKVSPYTPYIAPDEKITATPEPRYQQTTIGLSGTIGGNDLRPLVDLNNVTVGNDYVAINRLRFVAVLFTSLIFILINFFCSLTRTVRYEYYTLVHITIGLYCLIQLAIYLVYPRIKAVFNRKKVGIRQCIISLVILVIIIIGSIAAGTGKLLWLLIFTMLPLTEFSFMLMLRKRSWFTC